MSDAPAVLRRPRSAPRARSIAARKLTRAEVEQGARLAAWMPARAPTTRGECVNGVRPCPFVRCRQHLYLDVNPETGSIKLNFPDKNPWQLRETCALDVADRGENTLEDVGGLLNLTRERVRQIEVKAMCRVQGASGGMEP